MLSLIALLNSIPAVVYGALAIIAAVFLDALLGEPKRWHLLAGFGWLANQIERKLNRGNFRFARAIGMLAWLILITPFTVLAYVTTHSPLSWLIEVALLYFSLGARSLIQHAQNVYTPLMQSDIHSARQAVSLIVSRDTSRLDETEIVKATVESVLENGNDAVFGAIFWFVMLGGTGALLFRLANTLDAMWGYRTPRFLLFGWASCANG